MFDLEEIINRCKKNDRQAQVILYNWLAPKLLGLCVRYFKDRGEAEDVMQDSIVKIFMSIGSYRFEGSFEAWCRRITVNTTLNRLKQTNKIKFERTENFVERIEDTEEESGGVEEAELIDCLNQLPEGYRTILNLFLFENFSHREIADRLKISESTSRSQYSRARQLLSRLIKEKIKRGAERFTE